MDVLDPAVSCRRVWVLLTRLPPWALAGGQPWGAEAELLAGLVDHVAYLTWVTLRAHGAKGASKPKPLRRPAALRDLLARAMHQQAARAAYPAGQRGDEGPVKTASWTAAVGELAAIKGVVIKEVGPGG